MALAIICQLHHQEEGGAIDGNWADYEYLVFYHTFGQMSSLLKFSKELRQPIE